MRLRRLSGGEELAVQLIQGLEAFPHQSLYDFLGGHHGQNECIVDSYALGSA